MALHERCKSKVESCRRKKYIYKHYKGKNITITKEISFSTFQEVEQLSRPPVRPRLSRDIAKWTTSDDIGMVSNNTHND